MKPKILIFINTLGFGGAERVVSQLLAHLQNDFEIHLALLTRIIDYEVPQNIKIFDLKQPISENGIITLLKLPLLSVKLKQYCKTNNIPTCISFLNRPCYISGFMRGLSGFKGKIIMCERTHQSTLFENDTLLYKTISTALIKYAYNKADLVLSNSIVMKDDLFQNFDIKVPMDVIYNPIDIAVVKAKSMEEVNFKFDKNSFYFISVGGFRKEKNHALLLEAMSFLKGTNAKLIFVGGGELHNSLIKKTEELDLFNEVVFAGFDSNPYKYIRRSDCLISSSYVEGFPNVLLEALACSKAIISTDCKSGPREILAPDTDPNYQLKEGFEIAEFGILTSVKSARDIASAMQKLMEDQTLKEKFESKALQRASMFDISIIKNLFKKVFEAKTV